MIEVSSIKILLTTMNAKYIHKNLALRWIYQSSPSKEQVILKEYTIKDDVQRIAKEIVDMHVDVVAFSTYIWNIEQFQQLIIELKKISSVIHIIAGGPEVSFESYYLLDKGVDALSIGEGEISIWKYMDMLEHGNTCEIEGIYTKQFPNKAYGRVPISYLEKLPDPYFLEMDQGRMDKQYLYFETSRGCPYNCAYCLSSTDRNVRMFSEEYVLDILGKIACSEVRQVKLLDRTFNADPKRALRIARFMNNHCVNQIFQFEIVAETLSEELLTFFLEEADKTRFRLEIGVQSFHAKTLEAVGRLQNNERLLEVITKLRDAEVMMHVDLIAGLPYEDYQTFETSFNTLFALHVKEIQLGILKLLKGTRLKIEKDDYGFEVEKQAPYQVSSTNWLRDDEMLRIEGAATACEKYYNSGKCAGTIKTILSKKWYMSAFALFVDLGYELNKLEKPYAPQKLFSVFFKVLPQVEKDELYSILMMDYYKLFKQRPPRLIKDKVTIAEKKKVFSLLIERGYESHHTLYHYGVVDAGYDQETGYQIIIYNQEQKLPKRYYMDYKKQRVKEI